MELKGKINVIYLNTFSGVSVFLGAVIILREENKDRIQKMNGSGIYFSTLTGSGNAVCIFLSV